MTPHRSSTSVSSPPGGPAGREPSFASPAGLRALLERLHAAGVGAWREDPEANALLAYSIERYAPLARSWHRDPGEAATAAFLAMLHDGVRSAGDPWAVLTRAVQISLSAESHAERHLTSTEKARREQHAQREIPLRSGERAETLAGEPEQIEREPQSEPAIEQAVLLLSLLGWPQALAGATVEYVAARLADAGSITAAYETLRRDEAILVQLDLQRRTWTRLLAVLLGSHPQPGRPSASRGVLERLLSGESVRELLDDTALVAAVLATAPDQRLRAGGDQDE